MDLISTYYPSLQSLVQLTPDRDIPSKFLSLDKPNKKLFTELDLKRLGKSYADEKEQIPLRYLHKSTETSLSERCSSTHREPFSVDIVLENMDSLHLYLGYPQHVDTATSFPVVQAVHKESILYFHGVSIYDELVFIDNLSARGLGVAEVAEKINNVLLEAKTCSLKFYPFVSEKKLRSQTFRLDRPLFDAKDPPQLSDYLTKKKIKTSSIPTMSADEWKLFCTTFMSKARLIKWSTHHPLGAYFELFPVVKKLHPGSPLILKGINVKYCLVSVDNLPAPQTTQGCLEIFQRKKRNNEPVILGFVNLENMPKRDEKQETVSQIFSSQKRIDLIWDGSSPIAAEFDEEGKILYIQKNSLLHSSGIIVGDYLTHVAGVSIKGRMAEIDKTVEKREGPIQLSFKTSKTSRLDRESFLNEWLGEENIDDMNFFSESTSSELLSENENSDKNEFLSLFQDTDSLSKSSLSFKTTGSGKKMNFEATKTRRDSSTPRKTRRDSPPPTKIRRDSPPPTKIRRDSPPPRLVVHGDDSTVDPRLLVLNRVNAGNVSPRISKKSTPAVRFNAENAAVKLKQQIGLKSTVVIYDSKAHPDLGAKLSPQGTVETIDENSFLGLQNITVGDILVSVNGSVSNLNKTLQRLQALEEVMTLQFYQTKSKKQTFKLSSPVVDNERSVTATSSRGSHQSSSPSRSSEYSKSPSEGSSRKFERNRNLGNKLRKK